MCVYLLAFLFVYFTIQRIWFRRNRFVNANATPRCKHFIGKFNGRWLTAVCTPQFQFIGKMDAILI